MDPILEEAARAGKDLYKEAKTEEFLARCRRVGLVSLMFYTALMCIFKISYTGETGNGSAGSLLLSILIILTAVYFISGIISLVLAAFVEADDRQAKRKLAEYRAGLSVKNGELIRFFKGISFWGTIAALFAIFLLRVPAEKIFSASPSPASFEEFFCGILYWSVTAFVFLVFFQFLHICFYVPHRGKDAVSIPKALGDAIKSDVTLPVSIFHLKGADGRTVTESLLSMAFFIFLLAGMIVTAL